jgi:hypothetical protein
MDEKAMDLTLITAVLSIPAKQAFEWSEKTLDNISETLMREVRLAVVRCDDSGLKGNIDILYTDWMQQLEVTHIVTKVNWVLDPGIPCNCYYIAQGSYTYEYTLTTESGPRKITAAGSIDGTGTLQIINDPNLKIMVGCDYLAQGSLFTHLVNFDNQEYLATIAWLPGIKAYLGPGGSFEGETREDNTYNSTVIKWSFSVPGAK